MTPDARTILLVARLLVCAAGLAALCPPGAAASEATCDPSVPPHPCLDGATADCEAAVGNDAYSISARIALCDAYLAEDAILQALTTLDEGLVLCGAHRFYCGPLHVALANVRAIAEAQPPERQAERDNEIAALRARCLVPSRDDASVRACQTALAVPAAAPELSAALAAKYYRRDASALSILAYRRATALGGDGYATDIAAATRLRTTQALACLEKHELDECNASVLPGSDDEAAIQRQRGLLLAAADRPGAATSALVIAQSLAPEDPEIGAPLLVLLDRDPAAVGSNPLLRLARADALLATGQLGPALLAYREVPERIREAPGVAERITRAAGQRRNQVMTGCLDGVGEAGVIDCRSLLIPGLPDAGPIRERMAALEAQVGSATTNPPPAADPAAVDNTASDGVTF